MKEEIYNGLLAGILIALGLILLGNVVNIWNTGDFFAGWWTLFIMGFGLMGIILKKIKSSYVYIFLLGLVMLLDSQSVINHSEAFVILLSFFVVVLGINILYSMFSKNKLKFLENNVQPFYSAILGSLLEKFNSTKMQGTNVICVFGSADLDFSNTKITEDIVVNVNCVLGEVELAFPKNVGVILNNRTILGNSENGKSKATRQVATVKITGKCILGSIEIK